MNYSHYLLKLRLTDFVNNFCFQKLFPLPPFLPWLCHRILSSPRKREQEQTLQQKAVESHCVAGSRLAGDQTVLALYSVNTLRLCLPPTSFTKALYTFHLSSLHFFSSVLHFESAVTSAQTAWIPLQTLSSELQHQQQRTSRPTEQLQKREEQFSPGVPERGRREAHWRMHAENCLFALREGRHLLTNSLTS